MDKSHDQKSSSPLTTSPLACVTREYGGASPLSFLPLVRAVERRASEKMRFERETESGGGGGGGDGDGGGGCHTLAVGGAFASYPFQLNADEGGADRVSRVP